MSVPHKHTEYSKINQYIYIGTNFCCQKHFDNSLLKKGLTVDISLEEISIDTPNKLIEVGLQSNLKSKFSLSKKLSFKEFFG